MQTEAERVFNPEGIEEGDKVRLHSEGPRSRVMVVRHMSGRFGSKVFCREVGYELNANCFKLVEKGAK